MQNNRGKGKPCIRKSDPINRKGRREMTDGEKEE